MEDLCFTDIVDREVCINLLVPAENRYSIGKYYFNQSTLLDYTFKISLFNIHSILSERKNNLE